MSVILKWIDLRNLTDTVQYRVFKPKRFHFINLENPISKIKQSSRINCFCWGMSSSNLLIMSNIEVSIFSHSRSLYRDLGFVFIWTALIQNWIYTINNQFCKFRFSLHLFTNNKSGTPGMDRDFASICFYFIFNFGSLEVDTFLTLFH